MPNLKRILYLALGIIAAILTIAAWLIPGLPFLPFLVLAAWLLCRCSPRFQRWVMGTRAGIYLRAVESSPKKIMIIKAAIVLTLVVLTVLTDLLLVEGTGAQIGVAALGLVFCAVIIFDDFKF